MYTILFYFQTYPILTIYLIAINLVTIVVYGSDKISARAHTWRTRERTLLVLALIGGSPGALIVMKLFHHKTRKGSFGILITLILLLQIVVGWWTVNNFFQLL